MFVVISGRCVELNEKDRLRREKEIAQNNLETFILDTSDKLSQAEFEAVTTEKERTSILEKCSEVKKKIFFFFFFFLIFFLIFFFF